MPGPQPLPTALKILRGNPGRRPLNQHEPQPEVRAPECPDYIQDDPVALAYWEHYLPILLGMRVLTVADETVLASFCITHSNLIANLHKVRELNANGPSKVAGIVIATKTGYLAPNQFYLNVQACMEQELKFCRELGLSPSARTRIHALTEKDKTDDPWGSL